MSIFKGVKQNWKQMLSKQYIWIIFKFLTGCTNWLELLIPDVNAVMGKPGSGGGEKRGSKGRLLLCLGRIFFSLLETSESEPLHPKRWNESRLFGGVAMLLDLTVQEFHSLGHCVFVILSLTGSQCPTSPVCSQPSLSRASAVLSSSLR